MIGFAAFGLVVGVLARILKPGRQNLSLFVTLLVGLAGSVIGGMLANFIGAGDIFELNVIGSIVAIASAVALLGVAEGMASSPNTGERGAGPRETPGSDEGVSAARLAEGWRDWGGPP